MGRKLGFEREEALRRATEVFWKRGYVNSSVAQLQKAMKLGEGSFYNTFKSKKRLYLECLRHYNGTSMRRRSQALGSDRPAKQRIQEFFDVVIDDLAGNKAPGCLVSNSLSNEVLAERDLKRYLFAGLESFLEYLASLIAEGQQRGELAAELDPQATARVLFTYLHGLHRLSVFNLDPERRTAETRAFLDAMLPTA